MTKEKKKNTGNGRASENGRNPSQVLNVNSSGCGRREREQQQTTKAEACQEQCTWITKAGRFVAVPNYLSFSPRYLVDEDVKCEAL